MAARKTVALLLGFSLVLAGCRGAQPVQPRETPDLIPFGTEQRIGRANLNPAWPFLRTAPDGRIYLLWTQQEENAEPVGDSGAHQHGASAIPRAAYLMASADGTSWSEPVRINDLSEVVQGDENEPKVAFGHGGRTYAVWAVPGSQGSKMKGNIRFSMMDESGRFGPSQMLNEVPDAARFPWLEVGPDGTAYVAWLDRRIDSPAPRQVYLTRIGPDGRTLTETYQIADDSCECCRLVMAFADDGKRVHISYRQKPENNIRNIVVVTSTDGGVTFGDPVVISDDGWEIGGCPHSGAVMETDSMGNLHIIWYTYGSDGKKAGIYYTVSADGGKSFAPRQLVHASAGAEVLRPYLAVGQDGVVYMAWNNLVDRKDGKENTQIFFRSLKADSVQFSPVQQVSSGDGNAVWPHIAVAGQRVHLAWTEQKGEEAWVVFTSAPIGP